MDIAFGRARPPKNDPRTLRLESYARPIVSPAPPEVHWATKVPHWSAMWNHKLNCCGVSSAGHIIQVQTQNNGHYNEPPDSAILADYQAMSGWTLSQGGQGPPLLMTTVLDYWRIRSFATMT